MSRKKSGDAKEFVPAIVSGKKTDLSIFRDGASYFLQLEQARDNCVRVKISKKYASALVEAGMVDLD
jgi:hypothetical protein